MTHKHFFTKSTFQYFTKNPDIPIQLGQNWPVENSEVGGNPHALGEGGFVQKNIVGFVGNILHKINFELRVVKE